MVVFLSWSGERSKLVANILKEWLPQVIQALKPWVSTQDIEQGSQWDNAIGDSLQKTNIGIICLTQENKEKPWILFEAGSLHKGLTSSRVCTFLIDLIPTDLLENPLSKFNHTFNNKDGVFKLLKTINGALENNKLPDELLSKIFEKNYSDLETEIENVLKKTEDVHINEKDLQLDMIKEILLTTRYLEDRISHIDNKIEDRGSLSVLKTLNSLKANIEEQESRRKTEEYIKQQAQF